MADEEKIYDAVEAASNTGKVRRGVNETTKAIEREKAKLVVIAKDVSPEAITMHLPVLCEEKKIPYMEVSSRKELGEATGIGVPVSALAIIEEGDSKKILEKLRKTHVVEEKPEEEEPKKEKAPKEETKPKEEKAEEKAPKEEAKEKPAEKKPKEEPKKEKTKEEPVEKKPKEEKPTEKKEKPKEEAKEKPAEKKPEEEEPKKEKAPKEETKPKEEPKKEKKKKGE